MDKKGGLGNQALSIVFVFIIIIIVGGIAISAYIFFGNGYNTKQAEASLLNKLVRVCIYDGADLSDTGKFFEKCNLNKEVLEKNDYLVRICEKDCFNGGKVNVFINSNHEACKFDAVKENPYYRICTMSKVKSNGIEYQVVTGSGYGTRRENV